MEILIADKFPQSRIEQLAAAGHDVRFEPGLKGRALRDAVFGADVLVVRSTKVKTATIEAADKLTLIIRAGAGYNTIDWQTAASRGIYVSNVPGMNAVAVAELTMGLICALDRRIPDAVTDLREGRWRKSTYAKATGLAGRTLGIIGFGDIGMAVARRASAFDMRIVVEDRPGRPEANRFTAEELGVDLVPDRASLLSQSDIVSIHVPSNDDTRHLVDAEFLAGMKRGAWLINTSRGEVVDEPALLAALDARDLRAGLDVYEEEPASGDEGFDSPLASHPAVYGTHHIGASTEQAQLAIADEVVALIEDFARGVVRNAVNLELDPEGTVTLAVRHANRVGVLARVLGVLRTAGLNVAQMQNRIFIGGTAGTATIHVEGNVEQSTLDEVARLDDVIGISVAAT